MDSNSHVHGFRGKERLPFFFSSPGGLEPIGVRQADDSVITDGAVALQQPRDWSPSPNEETRP